MGFILILVVCAIIAISQKEKITQTEVQTRSYETERAFKIRFLAIIAMAITIAMLGLKSATPYTYQYQRARLRDVIQVEQIENDHVFINYSYDTKCYSYKKDGKIQTIHAEKCFVKEISYRGNGVKIEHYKLTGPKSFWVAYLPWMVADQYLIYIPEERMISRT